MYGLNEDDFVQFFYERNFDVELFIEKQVYCVVLAEQEQYGDSVDEWWYD